MLVKDVNLIVSVLLGCKYFKITELNLTALILKLCFLISICLGVSEIPVRGEIKHSNYYISIISHRRSKLSRRINRKFCYRIVGCR